MQKLWCNKGSTYIDRLTPSSSKRRHHFETCTFLEYNKNLGHGSWGYWSMHWWRLVAIWQTVQPTKSERHETEKYIHDSCMTQFHKRLRLYWPVAIYSKLTEQDSWLSATSCGQWGQETLSMKAVKGTSIPRSRYQATTNEK